MKDKTAKTVQLSGGEGRERPGAGITGSIWEGAWLFTFVSGSEVGTCQWAVDLDLSKSVIGCGRR